MFLKTLSEEVREKFLEIGPDKFSEEMNKAKNQNQGNAWGNYQIKKVEYTSSDKAIVTFGPDKFWVVQKDNQWHVQNRLYQCRHSKTLI